jgi:hypothetical protein
MACGPLLHLLSLSRQSRADGDTGALSINTSCDHDFTNSVFKKCEVNVSTNIYVLIKSHKNHSHKNC